MKFDKVIGKCSPELIRKAQDKLSAIFTELSLGFDNKAFGSNLGGDPLTFQLVYPLPHICDALSVQLDDLKEEEKAINDKIKNGETLTDEEKKFLDEDLKAFRRQMGSKVLRTAATDGKRFYWNPKFVLDCSGIGLRIVVQHEAWHAIFLHPERRRNRLPRLWNIAVDYRVNYTIMEDLKSRNVRDYPAVFTKSLGEYITLEEYAAFLRDPFNPPPRLAHLNPILALKSMADPAYVDPYKDVPPMYYADHQLSDDMKRPENVYEYLLAQIPKCPKCGKLGKYKKPQEYKDLEKKIKEQKKKEQEKKKKEEDKKKKLAAKEKSEETHNHDGYDCEGDCCPSSNPGDNASSQPGDNSSNQPGEPSDDGCCGDEKGEGSSCCGDGCDECGSGDDYADIDPFGAGDTLDDHIDSDISEEELAKRLTDAVEMSKKMAGRIPGGLEEEISSLISPKLRWEDFLRQQMTKKRNGYGKNDWLRPKSRPLFAGLYSPRRRDYFLNILAAYDCSGSMSADDIAFGISQLQVIDERGEAYLLPWDSGEPYWDSMVKIKKVNKDELQKARAKGRGGTNCSAVLNGYEKKIGKMDVVIIITDGFLYDGELKNVHFDPKTEYIWLITSHNPNFRPPRGRVFHLRNE